MELNGGRVYFQGVKANSKFGRRVSRIVQTVKALSPTADVGMRILKNGDVYEGMVWGKAGEMPIGIYKRGPSLENLLDTLDERVHNECLKVCQRTAVKPENQSDGSVRNIFADNILTPVALSGVVAPWNECLGGGVVSDYKLVSYSGCEYFIVADSEWREVLSRYCWEDVKVTGLLNVSNMTLIPQRVYPRGPTGERESVMETAAWKAKDLVAASAA